MSVLLVLRSLIFPARHIWKSSWLCVTHHCSIPTRYDEFPIHC